MRGYLSLVLHAHLPFVRHPEHPRSLEELWLYEAITECYIPLLRAMEAWRHAGIAGKATVGLSPTLCAMLGDEFLKKRYLQHLEALIDLADKEIHRTSFEPAVNRLSQFYHQRFLEVRAYYLESEGDLLGRFRQLQDDNQIEIITCAATHAILPLLMDFPGCVRAQLLVARDSYRTCFGRDPRGIWLPECAYTDGLDAFLLEAGLRWCVLESHGVLNATPRPAYGCLAPLATPAGFAVFGRDVQSARQVWSRQAGYPGDRRYRDFYRDLGFDAELEYVRPHLPLMDRRGFSGVKYHRIGSQAGEKELYQPDEASQAVTEHAVHFLKARVQQFAQAPAIPDVPPHLVAPYDAELFGHWWFEGPEFIDVLLRKTCQFPEFVQPVTPSEYLDRHGFVQHGKPSPSSWGEGGHLGMWLNETNEWVYRQLRRAQAQMCELGSTRWRRPLQARAARQAGRELLLAQASDWPFMMKMGTSPVYAREQVDTHLKRFQTLASQVATGHVDVDQLTEFEDRDNLFPELDYRYWAEKPVQNAGAE